MNIKDKAAGIRRLRDDETFKSLIEDVRGAQVTVFLNPHSSEEERMDAHHIVCALEKIEDRMSTILSDEAIFDKQQERGLAPWKRLNKK